jgi:hypothetical protein
VNPTDWLITHAGLAPSVAAWLSAFTLTQLVEIPIYIHLIRARDIDSRAPENANHPHPSFAANPTLTPHLHTSHPVARLALAFLPSALTHPLVWFAFPRLPLAYLPMVVCAELFAVTAEAALLRAVRVPQALGGAIVANAASLGVGLLLRAFVGWP